MTLYTHNHADVARLAEIESGGLIITGQFEWVDDRPKPPPARPYAEFQVEHDQHPIWPHGGRVPGVRRAHVDRRHNGQEVPR